MDKSLRIFFLAFFFAGSAFSAPKAPENPCPGSIDSVTEPAPVELGELLAAVKLLRTTEGKSAFDGSEKSLKALRDTFDLTKVKTKMEQFFRLLHVIQGAAPASLGSRIDFEPEVVRQALLISKTFTDPAVPAEIEKFLIDRTNRDDVKFEAQFSKEKTELPFNKGEGFYAFEDGRCQHTKSLIFDRKFSFTVRQLKNGNIIARYFKGADIFGDFGSKGLFTVDLQYVSLEAVEFFKGTKLGRVEAKVSPEEFRKNDHNPLLRIITKFVGNSSVQPIDW